MSTTTGYVAMVLLAIQFGMQPVLYKEFAANAVHSSALVIGCELLKLLFALIMLMMNNQLGPTLKQWTLAQSLKASGLPACTYAIQNLLLQVAYQHLPPIVFNLINQTKLLWTAVSLFLVMGTRYSFAQCIAMVLLLSAAVLLSLAKEDGGKDTQNDMNMSFETGLVPALGASMLSGVGAALTQRAMQTDQRAAALVTIELSLYGSIFLCMPFLWQSLVDITQSPDTLLETRDGAWLDILEGCDEWTLVPVISNAFGGILVGTVTKSVGGVMKSFALICGIALTAVTEAYVYNKVLPMEVWMAAGLVAISMYLYSSYPYVSSPKTKTE